RKAIILSVDDLMLKLSDSCLGDRHGDVVGRCERYFYGLSEQIVSSGLDVIIDFGYWSKKERDAAKEYYKKAGITAELHYIKTSEEERSKRLAQRNEILQKQYELNPKERLYIIGDELKDRLDLKFEEPSEAEIDVLISDMN
ncbi:MAG TPA: AAA family ATPase, partial [Mobilitalea sp.]|nr:AAA family ATPase [Mobilitalea sp.]